MVEEEVRQGVPKYGLSGFENDRMEEWDNAFYKE